MYINPLRSFLMWHLMSECNIAITLIDLSKANAGNKILARPL